MQLSGQQNCSSEPKPNQVHLIKSSFSYSTKDGHFERNRANQLELAGFLLKVVKISLVNVLGLALAKDICYTYLLPILFNHDWKSNLSKKMALIAKF